jgi:hypothetical protein
MYDNSSSNTLHIAFGVLIFICLVDYVLVSCSVKLDNPIVHSSIVHHRNAFVMVCVSSLIVGYCYLPDGISGTPAQPNV